MFKRITEEKAQINVPSESKVSKKLPVFYNPVMKLNRDVSVVLLNALDLNGMQIALPLAGTGIRAVRFEKELSEGIVERIYANDLSETAVRIIRQNISDNGCKKIETANKDANIFMEGSTGFDYIDIDPFGTPNPFLDPAVKRISRRGILAVTATDTACMSGTYPKACERKYYARPMRNELKHEAGLRIEIRKVQLVGAQYERALVPVFSYSKDHYFRVFFRSIKSKEHADCLIDKHKFLLYCTVCCRFEISDNNFGQCCGRAMDHAGPMYMGDIFDKELAEKMLKINSIKDIEKFLAIAAKEARTSSPFFYDLHTLAKKLKLKSNPKKQEVIDKIISVGKNASETHFLGTAVKTDVNYEDFCMLIKNR